MPWINDNGARAKSVQPRTIPTSAGLVRLYADYLHGEYVELDSDYVFVNLWGEPRGHPLTYAAVYDLVKRLRRRTGIDFDPHWCRHTYATSYRPRARLTSVPSATPRRPGAMSTPILPRVIKGVIAFQYNAETMSRTLPKGSGEGGTRSEAG